MLGALGALATLAERLPQTLQQLTGFLERQLHDGVIEIDAGTVFFAGDPITAVAIAGAALQGEAVSAAQQLQAALARAQQAISGASSSRIR